MDALPTPAVVVRYGKIVATKGDGARSGYTLSGSKSLTALIAGTLLQRGLIGLDTLVPGSDVPAAPLASFRQFMSMTSDYSLSPHNPGHHYAYSNSAVSFYGDHINARYFSGLDKVAMLRRAYLDTLGHEDPIAFRGTASGWGNGGWSLSSRDFARVGYLVLREGNWQGQQLVPRSFIQSLYQNQIPSGATAGGTGSGDFDNQTGTTAKLPGHYSFGFWIAGGVKLPAVMASGDGGTRLYVVPSRDLILSGTASSFKIPESVVNMFIDAIVSTTPPAGGDTTAPSVSITAPAAGASVGGTVTIAASASDNVGVAGVRFLVDGTALGAEDVAAPYSIAWNAGAVSAGSHTLAARARDAAGNERTASITVTVGSGGTQAVTKLVLINADTDQPVAGFDPIPDNSVVNLAALPSRRLNVQAVTQPATVGSVKFVLNGSTFRVENGAPYALAGDTSGNYNPWSPAVGSYTLAATPFTGANAGGAAGLPLTRAFAVTDQAVTPDTTPPVVRITAPAAGATLSGIVTLTAAASDDRGVAGVQFLVDGTPAGAEELLVPYQISWDTAGHSGAHTIAARARDAAGNQATSAGVGVTVDGGTGSPAPAIVSLTLINAGTDQPVSGFDPLRNGAVLQLSALPAGLNVRANTNPAAVGSVVFTLDGRPFRTENGAPYALAGDTAGNYLPWVPAVGSRTLTVTPYTGTNASGTAGAPYSIMFTVAK